MSLKVDGNENEEGREGGNKQLLSCILAIGGYFKFERVISL